MEISMLKSALSEAEKTFQRMCVTCLAAALLGRVACSTTLDTAGCDIAGCESWI